MRAWGLIVGFAMLSSLASAGSAQTCAPVNIVSIAQELLSRINGERSAFGLPALRISSALGQIAQSHACDMVARNFFSHTGSNQRGALERVHDAGYHSCMTAENIAMGQRSAAQAHSSWMGSSGHRQNTLRADVSELGVGVGITSNGRGMRWVTVYAQPC
jgi:uncharacterized protein YkwD